MKIVIAIDSLKGSLSSLEAGEAMKDGILKAMPDAEVWVRPMADGGEGTVEALTLGMQGQLETVTVTGPLGKPVEATYGIVKEKHLAVLEMSAAAGITLVEEKDRNPLYTALHPCSPHRGFVTSHAIRKEHSRSSGRAFSSVILAISFSPFAPNAIGEPFLSGKPNPSA